MKAVGKYYLSQDSLGEGQFGQVFKCCLRDDHQQFYACKVINKKRLVPRIFQNLKNEISILNRIQSPNVVKLYDIQRTENNFYMIMEFCNGGDLEHLKNIRGRFKETEARIILQQLVAGFKEIYGLEVIHRDLKLANILVNFPETDFGLKKFSNPIDKSIIMQQNLKEIDLVKSKMQIKIADLGFARELKKEDLTGTQCGTPLVMAPEVLNGKKYNHKADVWSLGIVYFEMLTGFTPFTGRDKIDLKQNLETGEYKLPKTLRMSLQGLDFLNGCLQYEISERMSWDQLITHPYIVNAPNEEKPAEDLHLSYSEKTGQYIQDDSVDNSSFMLSGNPYAYLTERNAILLNCKNPQKFNEVYEKTIQKHFHHILDPNLAVLNNQQVVLDKMSQSMGRIQFEEEKNLSQLPVETSKLMIDANEDQIEESDQLDHETVMMLSRKVIAQNLDLHIQLNQDTQIVIDERTKVKHPKSQPMINPKMRVLNSDESSKLAHNYHGLQSFKEEAKNDQHLYNQAHKQNPEQELRIYREDI